MNPRKPRAYRAEEVSLLRRLLALVGLVVFVGASFAQAAHVHGEWLPHGPAQVDARGGEPLEAGGEAGCPLCVSMHAAAVTAQFVYAPAMSVTALGDVRGVERVRGTAWPFVLFCRPPPGMDLA